MKRLQNALSNTHPGTLATLKGKGGKNTVNWVEELVETILKRMLNPLPGMEYDYWEPFGTEKLLTVYFYPESIKSSEGILTGKEILSITFLLGKLMKQELFVRDFTRNLDVFKKVSFEDLNGRNYAKVSVKLDACWLVGWLEKQNKRSWPLHKRRR